MDLKYSTQNDVPFNLAIQTNWQLEMMAKFGHNNALLELAKHGFDTFNVWIFITCLLFNVMSCYSICKYFFPMIV
jgi:hypothetical protein